MFQGTWTVVKNNITACDYDYVLKAIRTAIKNRTRLLISPVASQTLAIAHDDPRLAAALDGFDMLVPDGQWVRHALYFLYGLRLPDRVYGPELTKRICNGRLGYRIFLYGNRPETLARMTARLRNKWDTRIVGTLPSVFRSLSRQEERDLVSAVMKSRAEIMLVSLGSPLQELFSHRMSSFFRKKKYPVVIIPVGAAFDFLSEVKKQAPPWMGNSGIEWFYRLMQEPRRLGKRYLYYGSYYLALIVLQKLFYAFDYKFIKGETGRGKIR